MLHQKQHSYYRTVYLSISRFHSFSLCVRRYVAVLNVVVCYFFFTSILLAADIIVNAGMSERDNSRICFGCVSHQRKNKKTRMKITNFFQYLENDFR